MVCLVSVCYSCNAFFFAWKRIDFENGKRVKVQCHRSRAAVAKHLFWHSTRQPYGLNGRTEHTMMQHVSDVETGVITETNTKAMVGAA
jgi:hypothetical protein